MRIRYDRSSDAAMIFVVDGINDGEAVNQVEVPLPGRPVDMYLDFDRAGFLLGVEIIGASGLLRSDVLDAAEQIGPA